MRAGGSDWLCVLPATTLLVIKGIARSFLFDCGQPQPSRSGMFITYGVSMFWLRANISTVLWRDPGHRSILRIGPAGERGVAFAGINVDYVHGISVNLAAGPRWAPRRLRALLCLATAVRRFPKAKAYRDFIRRFIRKSPRRRL